MNITVKTVSGEHFEFSYQQGLIMAHSSFISAQWHPDQVGVQLLKQPNNVSVSFMATAPVELRDYYFPNIYQNFFFAQECYDDLYKFFKTLRFPLHNSNPFSL